MSKLKIENQEEKVTKKINTKIPKTILENIDCIVELVCNSKLSDDFFKKAKKNIDFVAKKMNLTQNQVVLFSIFVEKSDDQCIEIREIASFAKCSNIKILNLMNDIDELENRRLIRCNRSFGRPSYRVPFKIIRTIKQNKNCEKEGLKNLSTEELFTQINNLINERMGEELTQNAFVSELNTLFQDNSSLAFCQQLQLYIGSFCKTSRSFLLLTLFCHYFINEANDNIGVMELHGLLDRNDLHKINRLLLAGKHVLQTSNIIENAFENGMANTAAFRLSEKAKEKLFVDLNIKTTESYNKQDLMLHDEIVAKKLFYNEREQSQIAQLSSLLQKKNFLSVQERLEKSGMRKGFACLFYGAPGTGKTETVYQLARATGRDIMMVDISESKSKWYGESEKRVKGIFDRYRALVKTCAVTPILLFNEADAILGKRESGKDYIDQTANAIQNILLQEIENLNGIMIATTNLTQNLDSAFERRFLYKIEFDKPSVEAKEKIWQAMLPKLAKKTRVELADKYSFSGGQIENIVRKYTVDSILTGEKPTTKAMHDYCLCESLNQNDRKRIGF